MPQTQPQSTQQPNVIYVQKKSSTGKIVVIVLIILLVCCILSILGATLFSKSFVDEFNKQMNSFSSSSLSANKSNGLGDDVDNTNQDFSNVSQEPTVAGQFLPKVNGFSFPNYGNESNTTNLTPAMMYDIFGSSICLNKDRNNCKLNSVADTWMNSASEKLQIGHCAGFTVLSNFMKSGYVSPQKFGAQNAYGISFNSEIQAELAKWASYQFIDSKYTQPINTTPAEAINILSQSFPQDGYMLLIFQPGYRGGHAVTPTRVINDGNGKYRIGIYDNNLPGIERYVSVDKNLNTWEYYATINPGYPEAQYSGDSDTQTLLVAKVSAMKVRPACGDMCSASDNSDEQSSSSTSEQSMSSKNSTSSPTQFDNEVKDADIKVENQLMFVTNNDFEITDPNGDKFVFKKGEIDNNTKTVTFIPILSGITWNGKLPPVVNLESNLIYKLRIFKGADTNANFTYFNKSTAFSLDKSVIVNSYTDLTIDTKTSKITINTEELDPQTVKVDNSYDGYDQTLKFENMDFFDDIFNFSVDESANNENYSLDGLKNTDVTVDRSSATQNRSVKYNLTPTEEESKRIDLWIHSSDNPVMFEADQKALGLVKKLSTQFENIF